MPAFTPTTPPLPLKTPYSKALTLGCASMLVLPNCLLSSIFKFKQINPNKGAPPNGQPKALLRVRQHSMQAGSRIKLRAQSLPTKHYFAAATAQRAAIPITCMQLAGLEWALHANALLWCCSSHCSSGTPSGALAGSRETLASTTDANACFAAHVQWLTKLYKIE